MLWHLMMDYLKYCVSNFPICTATQSPWPRADLRETRETTGICRWFWYRGSISCRKYKVNGRCRLQELRISGTNR